MPETTLWPQTFEGWVVLSASAGYLLTMVCHLQQRERYRREDERKLRHQIQHREGIPFAGGFMQYTIGWDEDDFPRTAVEPAYQRPPEPEPEEDDPEIALRAHQRELDEWDEAFMRQMLGDE